MTTAPDGIKNKTRTHRNLVIRRTTEIGPESNLAYLPGFQAFISTQSGSVDGKSTELQNPQSFPSHHAVRRGKTGRGRGGNACGELVVKFECRWSTGDRVHIEFESSNSQSTIRGRLMFESDLDSVILRIDGRRELGVSAGLDDQLHRNFVRFHSKVPVWVMEGIVAHYQGGR